MAKKEVTHFYLWALWDAELEVWFSVTDISGLFIETDTLTDFNRVYLEVIGELMRSNHPEVECCYKVDFQAFWPTDTGVILKKELKRAGDKVHELTLEGRKKRARKWRRREVAIKTDIEMRKMKKKFLKRNAKEKQ